MNHLIKVLTFYKALAISHSISTLKMSNEPNLKKMTVWVFVSWVPGFLWIYNTGYIVKKKKKTQQNFFDVMTDKNTLLGNKIKYLRFSLKQGIQWSQSICLWSQSWKQPCVLANRLVKQQWSSSPSSREEISLVSAPRTAPLGCCSLFTLTRPNTGLDLEKQHRGGLAMFLECFTDMAWCFACCEVLQCPCRLGKTWHGFSIRWRVRVVYLNNKSPSQKAVHLSLLLFIFYLPGKSTALPGTVLVL